MSDTQRKLLNPTWNPSHRRWPFGEMTEKFQTRDHASRHCHRFAKGLRNSRHNILQKIEALREKEAFE